MAKNLVFQNIAISLFSPSKLIFSKLIFMAKIKYLIRTLIPLLRKQMIKNFGL